jgi:hypothetical protein
MGSMLRVQGSMLRVQCRSLSLSKCNCFAFNRFAFKVQQTYELDEVQGFIRIVQMFYCSLVQLFANSNARFFECSIVLLFVCSIVR